MYVFNQKTWTWNDLDMGIECHIVYVHICTTGYTVISKSIEISM